MFFRKTLSFLKELSKNSNRDGTDKLVMLSDNYLMSKISIIVQKTPCTKDTDFLQKLFSTPCGSTIALVSVKEI